MSPLPLLPQPTNTSRSMKGAGYKEEEIKGWIQYIRERIGFWTDKQISMKIKSVTGPPAMR